MEEQESLVFTESSSVTVSPIGDSSDETFTVMNTTNKPPDTSFGIKEVKTKNFEQLGSNGHYFSQEINPLIPAQKTSDPYPSCSHHNLFEMAENALSVQRVKNL